MGRKAPEWPTTTTGPGGGLSPVRRKVSASSSSRSGQTPSSPFQAGASATTWSALRPPAANCSASRWSSTAWSTVVK